MRQLLLCISLLWSAAPWAAEPPATPNTLALSAAVDAALARDPQAAAFAAREREQDARAELADGLTPGPGSVTLGHTSDRLDRDTGKAEWELEAAWPLWLPGQRGAHAELARRESSALDATRQARRAALAADALESAGAWRLAALEAELAERRLEAASALQADLERRLAAGEVARFEANLARSEQVEARVAHEDARAALADAERAWRLLTGLPGGQPVLLIPSAVPAEDVEVPALRLAREAEAVATARLRSERARRREAPELALRVLHGRDERGVPWGNQLGVKLTIPFGGGPAWRADTAGAEAELAQAAAELQAEAQRSAATREQAELAVSRSARSLQAALARQRLAQDNLSLADKAYRLGEFDLETVLRARSAAHTAVLAVRRAEIGQEQAALKLLLARGVTP